MHPDRSDPWPRLRRRVGAQTARLSAPPPDAAGLCASCRGPARPGQHRCYHCGRHQEWLPGLLPDVVTPVAYAAKGGPHATSLWLYKSARPGAGSARAELSALLLVFLRDHGPCVWRRAGAVRPSHVAVVPSGRARPGAHPLRSLVAPYLALPWAGLSTARRVPACRDDPASRDPDPGRYRCERMPGATVLLLDDTWTSGASAVSAAAALKLAGARSVAVVVLGRHLDARAAAAPADGFAPGAMPFRPWLCAVHATVRAPGTTQ